MQRTKNAYSDDEKLITVDYIQGIMKQDIILAKNHQCGIVKSPRYG